MVTKAILFFLIMIAPLFGGALIYSTSQDEVTNAQTILFEINSEKLEAPFSKAYVAYLGTRYPFYKHPSKGKFDFYALVPTGYYTKAQKKNAVIVTIINGEKTYTSVPIMIRKGAYKMERLKVASSKTTISKKDKARIKRENREAKKLYKTFTKKSYIKEAFVRPLESEITSPFGTKRMFNGVLKSYHSGTDFRAAMGTEITAANAGKVVLVKNRFFAGNSVIIDHGQGIYTGYYHLSQFRVKKGDMVKQGDVIGLAGATGRVTGPHLHFAVHVGGVGVDPMQFLDTVNHLY